MNLYEVNPNLDNMLKRLNRRAISAAKSLGSNSETLRETTEAMYRISQATGAKVHFKKVNGTDVLQISRSAQPFISIKQGSMNDIALQRAIMMEKNIKGVQHEVEVHVGHPVTIGNFRSAAKQMKREMDKVNIMSDIEENNALGILGTIKWLQQLNIFSTLADAILDGRYNETYCGVIQRVEDAVAEQRAGLDELNRERESVRGTEKFAAVQQAYSELKEQIEQVEAALVEMREVYAGIEQRGRWRV